MVAKEDEFSPGDVVRITKGELAGYVGTVIKVDHWSQRLILLAHLEGEPSGEETINVSFSVVKQLSQAAGPPGAIRVVLVDHQRLVRAGLRSLLEQVPNIEVVAEATEGIEAIRIVEQHRPNVALIDSDLPAESGAEVSRHLGQTFPDVRVIMLSTYADEEHVNLALQAGATGYLLKSARKEELELAIRTVAQGETYLSPPFSKDMLARYSLRKSDDVHNLQTLSPRQIQVLKLLAEGKTTKQIGVELDISAKTAETHRLKLMNRLGTHDLAGLVRFAVRVGLIRSED